MTLKLDAPIAASAKAEAKDNGSILLQIETVIDETPEGREKRASLRAMLLPDHAELLAAQLLKEAAKGRQNLQEGLAAKHREASRQTQPNPPASPKPKTKK